ASRRPGTGAVRGRGADWAEPAGPAGPPVAGGSPATSVASSSIGEGGRRRRPPPGPEPEPLDSSVISPPGSADPSAAHSHTAAGLSPQFSSSRRGRPGTAGGLRRVGPATGLFPPPPPPPPPPSPPPAPARPPP